MSWILYPSERDYYSIWRWPLVLLRRARIERAWWRDYKREVRRW